MFIGIDALVDVCVQRNEKFCCGEFDCSVWFSLVTENVLMNSLWDCVIDIIGG